VIFDENKLWSHALPVAAVARRVVSLMTVYEEHCDGRLTVEATVVVIAVVTINEDQDNIWI
jgi:hypothetical protein